MSDIHTNKEFNKTKGRKFKLLCAKCSGRTNHEVLQSVDTNGSEVLDDHHGITIDWADWYQIVECLGCDTISFIHKTYFSEWAGPGPGDDGTETRLYPMRSEKSLAPKEFYNVPPKIRRIYLEVVEAFNGDSYILCAAGLRAVVEGICADKCVLGGTVQTIRNGVAKSGVRNNLEGKISGLREKEILTAEHATLLHEHRFLGNEAVHELAPPARDELSIAIEIIEHTLHGLYEVPQRGEDLRNRRSKRKT